MAVYLFGHLALDKRFWFDRVCVDQHALYVKTQTIQAIPAFIAKSREMLVLLDSTYFEKLWCNYELAVHVKTTDKADGMHCVPVWMPLSTLLWFGLYFLYALLGVQAFPAPPKIDNESTISILISLCDWWQSAYYMYIFLSIPTSWIFVQKAKNHKDMLSKIASFDFRNAKCTLETDRRVIEQQVLHLFDEALNPPLSVAFGSEPGSRSELDDLETLISTMEEIRHLTSYPTESEVIDHFNIYVRRELSNSVVRSIGREDYISLKMCIAASVPIMLTSSVAVLSCDGCSCEVPVTNLGYSSVSQYMGTNTVLQMFYVLNGILAFPFFMWANHWIANTFSGGIAELLAGSSLTALIWLVNFFGFTLEVAVLLSAVTKHSIEGVIGVVVCFIVNVWLVWLLFFRKQVSQQRILTLGSSNNALL